MRRQAQRSMQQYATVSVVMLLVTAGTSLYAWNPPIDDIPRFATLANAKPVAADGLAEISLDELVAAAEPAAAEPAALAAARLVEVAETTSAPEPVAAFEARAPELPAEYRDAYEAKAETTPATRLGAIEFSRDIDDEYQAIDPVRLFEPGFYTIYGTFAYEGMADGMEWAWVWWRDGEVVSGGSQLWAYGDDGPGYVYFNPEEGFQPGEYSLQVWINERLIVEGGLVVTTAAASR